MNVRFPLIQVKDQISPEIFLAQTLDETAEPYPRKNPRRTLECLRFTTG
jgi:hypothetical protein